MNQDLILILIGLGFLIIVGGVTIIVSIKRTGDKKEATEFLEGLSVELKNLILKIIRTINPDDFKDLDEEKILNIETVILKQIYDTCWDYVSNVVEKKSKETSDFFTEAVLALLQNKEFVESFILDLINKESIGQIIKSRATGIVDEICQMRLDESKIEDEELEKEYNKEEYIEESNDSDLTHGEAVVTPTEDELNELNPQVDEPEDLDPDNDPSVELIDEDIYFDKSGRARSRKTGKWIKVDNE